MTNGISRRKEKWGTTLMAMPFSRGKFTGMRVEAEVARPAAGRGSVAVRFSFSRLPIAEKFSLSEMVAWLEAQRAVMEASNEEAVKMRRTADEFETTRTKTMPKKRKPASSRR